MYNRYYKRFSFLLKIPIWDPDERIGKSSLYLGCTIVMDVFMCFSGEMKEMPNVTY